MVCSAAAIVFPPGELTTRTPFCVAALTSTLSTPTPALPIILSLLEELIISQSLEYQSESLKHHNLQ